jgi:hypothetical protein
MLEFSIPVVGDVAVAGAVGWVACHEAKYALVG